MNLATPDAAPLRPQWGRRRPTAQVCASILAVVLLAPVGYLFGQLWISNRDAATSVATDRAATAYARPLTRILDALVDARSTAVQGMFVDEATVRAAVTEGDGVDKRFGDLLRTGPRWDRLAKEITSTLARNPSGSDALQAYAAPIALTQALLTRIADASQATGDPARSYPLIDVALCRLPQAVASAGEMAALAFLGDQAAGTTPAAPDRTAVTQPDPQLAITRDRVDRTADDIGVVLRASSGRTAGYLADLHMLVPLDTFSAAADKLSQTAARLDASDSATRDRVQAAGSRLQTAALALDTAILRTADAQLTAQAAENAQQHRNLLLAGMAVPLALGALLWLRLPGPAALDAVGKPRHPAEAAGAGSERPERTPTLVAAGAAHDPGGAGAPRGTN